MAKVKLGLVISALVIAITSTFVTMNRPADFGDQFERYTYSSNTSQRVER